MTPVVIDASAGVELVADTVRGRSLRALLPPDAVPWVPELFYVECGAVLRRWDLGGGAAPLRRRCAGAGPAETGILLSAGVLT